MSTSPELRSSLQDELGFTSGDYTGKGWHNALVVRINELIVKDFQKLVAILYRLDISETKLKQQLKDQKESDAGEVIAKMIIERQIEKIKTREQYRNIPGLDENEKW